MSLKSSKDILLAVYVELMNISLSEGTMDTSKPSVIELLLKETGFDCDISNDYRPVNNLVVKKQLDQHMTINSLHEPPHITILKQ